MAAGLDYQFAIGKDEQNACLDGCLDKRDCTFASLIDGYCYHSYVKEYFRLTNVKIDAQAQAQAQGQAQAQVQTETDINSC